MADDIKQTILVVDDSPENIDVIVGLLKDHYKIKAATSGEKALAIIQKSLPDLILLDIMMPEMDGYEVCSKLKQNSTTKGIPVIFLTAKNEVADEVKGLDLGAVDYIIKPISPPIVLSRIKTHLALKKAQLSLLEKNETLKSTLEELESTQDQLVQSEKMAALGQLVAGIAHEINTPLGAIKSSSETADESLGKLVTGLAYLMAELENSDIDLFFKLLEMSLTSKPVSFSEKRSLAKELVSQLSDKGISVSTSTSRNLVDLGFQNDVDLFSPLLSHTKQEEILTCLGLFSNLNTGIRNITDAGSKAAKIIFALKTFAHFDHGGEKIETNVQEGIETVLTLYQSQIKAAVNLVEEYGDLPIIAGYPDELTQVWTNLIHNALQAMKNQGDLKIKTAVVDGKIVVTVSDSGPGIPEDIQEKIFQPFFTTKPAGEGSGLGLDIVKKIIKKHDGTIRFKSQPDVGTTFFVELPIN